MSVVGKVGERAYEFESFADLTKVRDIYAKFMGGQNEFEAVMESSGIEFTLDLLEYGL